MLAAIGETFETPLPKDGNDQPVPEQSDLVTGVIVSARPGLQVSFPSQERWLMLATELPSGPEMRQTSH